MFNWVLAMHLKSKIKTTPSNVTDIVLVPLLLTLNISIGFHAYFTHVSHTDTSIIDSR